MSAWTPERPPLSKRAKHAAQPEKDSQPVVPAKNLQFDTKHTLLADMSKRAADTSELERETIKNGERPMDVDQDENEAGEFEDEYEDEFESEDEIFEAGVDGRPDAEREAEEKESKHSIFGASKYKMLTNC